MKRRTTKTAARDRRYMAERETYLNANPDCEHRFEGCTGRSTEIDHRIPRGLAPHRVDDPSNFISCCHWCGQYRTNYLTREQRQELKLGIYADDYQP